VATVLVRIGEKTHETLRQLAKETHLPMQEIMAQAVEHYRRQRILAATNEAFAALQADPSAWREIEEERAIWDATLMDGLDGAE
jgi:predicted kinase